MDDVTRFLIATVIVTAASALQTATGMGMALLAAPLLWRLDPALVPGPTLCAVIALSLIVAIRGRNRIEPDVMPLAIAGLIGGSVAGAGIDMLFRSWNLAPVFGVSILLAVVITMLMPRAAGDAPPSRRALLIGGALAGVMGTMFAAHGPPIALALRDLRREALPATLCAFFALGGVVSIGFLAVAGHFGASDALTGAFLLPGVPLGYAVAPFIVRWLGGDTSRREWTRYAVWIISSLSAIALLVR